MLVAEQMESTTMLGLRKVSSEWFIPSGPRSEPQSFQKFPNELLRAGMLVRQWTAQEGQEVEPTVRQI